MTHFKTDVFISYAHIDNLPLPPNEKGWISEFHASLEALLSMRLGQAARIWRDAKLQGNDAFADEIVDQFSQTAVLVSILTPRYLKSDWCTREVCEFCEKAEQSGGVVLDNKARVFKVLKTPIETQERLPPVLREMLGYEFFTMEDDAPLELDRSYGERYSQDYNRKVGLLAWDISQCLKKLTDDDDTAAKATIYLAECSYDRKETRETIEGELRRHGYAVLPDQQLPRDQAEYAAAVEGLLSRCQLAVHLVGAGYGAVPDGPGEESVVVLQNMLALEKSRSSGLPRVIWLPEGTHSQHALQQAFIEALHNDAEAQLGADLITGDVEALKTAIHTALKHLERREEQPPTSAVADAERLIYLICTEPDRRATVPVRRYLREQGFEVSLPAFEGDATAVRELHQQLMVTCDATILFYGAGDEAWKRTMDNELRKMPAYRGDKPLLASYVYLADPKTSDKEDLIDLEEPDVINGLAGFLEAEMAAFSRDVKQGGAPG